MRYFLLLFSLVCVLDSQVVVGQNSSTEFDVVRTIPPALVTVGASYQSIERSGESISEFSTPLSAQLLLRPDLALTVGLSSATATGDNLQRVNGLTDVQLAVQYHKRFDGSRLILTLGMNIPSGTSQLSNAAYDTAVQLGLAQYGFNVPHFSQGGSIAPGLAFVTSLTQNIVVSVGGTYRIRNSYEPISELAEEYEWGDELLLTIGTGIELSAGLSLSADVIFTRYGEDKISDTSVYEAGDQLVAQLQLHRSQQNQDMWLTAKYRTINANRTLARGVLQTEILKSFPGFVKVSAQYRRNILPAFRASVLGESSWYEADVSFDALGVYSVGIVPEFIISPALSIPVQSKVIFGDLNGFEVGVGLVAIL